MALLSKEDIFAADDREFDTVDVPEWGGEVRIASISGTQRDKFEQSLILERGKDRKTNLTNLRAKLVALCAVDEGGKRMFTDEDVRRLGSKNAKPLDRVFEACQKLAGLSQEDVESLTEDFDETPDEASPTA